MTDKIELKLDKAGIRSKVAKNLNLSDIGTGSYIHTLVDGLLDVNEKTLVEVNKVIKDMFLETASEEVLEAYGFVKGVPRLKSRLAFSRTSSAEVSLEPHFFIHTADLDLKLFSKGDKVDVDVIRITFLEDVHYNSNLKKIYVSCEISVNGIAPLSTSYLKEGKSFNLSIPINFKTLLSDLVLTVETPMGFTDYEEDLEVYRSKLLALASSENISSETTFDKVITSSQSIFKYFVDKSVYPMVIYYMNPLVYYREDLETVVSSAEHYLKVHTDAIRGYTSNFTFSLPEKVEFQMNIITAENERLRTVLEGFLATFVTHHNIGYELVLDKEYLSDFLRKEYPEFNQPFDVEFYYTDGFNFIPTEDKSRLLIRYNAYPKLQGITINGDYSGLT